MNAPSFARVLTGTIAATAIFASSAMAHHGWDWAESGQVELKGTISEIYIGQPHPTLQVVAEDGAWTVELGNPRQTERAGFVEGSAEVGQTITALGNRSTDRSERRMKAVRITVGDKTFDIYPERIQS